ncbi:MAG: dienelactone hydrolase family protein [Armatimonadota bacterium]
MRTAIDRLVYIEAKGIRLEGMLGVPENAIGVVLFAHGSGSSRLSPRNQFVAKYLRSEGLGTLLIDLLEPEEAEDRSKVFNITLLADRLKIATDWLQKNDSTADLQIGYFGASTGAAAALMAAADRPEIGAVVSRGGRPDLAMKSLPLVKSPTLLIVGGMDVPVIQMNREAYDMLGGQKQMIIVPGATHLFEEPGTLEEVARLAAEWFGRYLESE